MKFPKLSALIIITLLAFSSCNTSKDARLLHEKRVLILGNSITQNGAYVDYLEYFLRKEYPSKKLDIISIGLSSETVNGASEEGHPFPRPCILTRVDSALHHIKPDLVLACYGMNDGIFSNPDKGRFSAYKKGIRKLNTIVTSTGAELILLTPTLFDPDPKKDRLSFDGEAHSYRNPYHKYNEVLDVFTDWLLSLKSEGIQVIDLHNFLRPILKEAKTLKADSTFIPDGVHPNDAGHFLMAKKILIDLYPEVNMGDPYPTVRDLKKDELFKTVAQRRKLRSTGWMEFIGYERGKLVKTDNIKPTQLKVQELDKKIHELLSLK